MLLLQANFKEMTRREDFEDLPKSTYAFLKRIQWNEGIVFDSSFAEFMKSIKAD